MKRSITVGITEARMSLSRLVDEVAKGSEVVIVKAGKPMAKLVPLVPLQPRRTPGSLKGEVRIPADFDAPLPDDLLRAFEGRD